MTPDYTDFRPSRLWKRMPADRRLAAAELFWSDEQSADQQIEAIAAIAAHMKFRTKSVVALPQEKRAKYLVNLPNIPDIVAARALVNYHLERHRAMMADFLDLLAITHENGLITQDEVPKPDREKLHAAASQLAAKYAADDVSLYFATLVSQDPDVWGELAEAPETQAVVTG